MIMACESGQWSSHSSNITFPTVYDFTSFPLRIKKKKFKTN